MKKLTLFVITIGLFVFLIGCKDRKTYDNTVVVSFYTFRNDSQIQPYLHVEPNSKIPEPDIIPIRSGYEFTGWFKDNQKTQPWDFDVDMVGEHSLLLQAGWLPGYSLVTYDINGGTFPADFKHLEDYPEDQRNPRENAELLKYLFFKVGDNKILFRPTRTGYTFRAWYPYDEYMWEGAPENATQTYKPGDRGFILLPSSEPGDITLYAHWDPIKLSISFRANYPEANVVANPTSRTRTYGLELIYDSNYDGESPDYNTLPDFAQYENLKYEFIGWNTRADGSGTWYREGDILERTAPITLFGQWLL